MEKLVNEEEVNTASSEVQIKGESVVEITDVAEEKAAVPELQLESIDSTIPVKLDVCPSDTAELKTDIDSSIPVKPEDVCPSNTAELAPVLTPGPAVFTSKPLCADYRSGSDSFDTESDSSESDNSDAESQTSDKSGKSKQYSHIVEDAQFIGKLTSFEDLKIDEPQFNCIEVGTVLSILMDTVMVQAYKDTPALDIDSMLFLNQGASRLGFICEVFGPVREPIYTIRFTSKQPVKNIKVGMKVYFAPHTCYTSYVSLAEIQKLKGTDASWKDNDETTADNEDFSNDEDEARARHKGNPTRKRPNSCLDGRNQRPANPFRGRYKHQQSAPPPSQWTVPDAPQYPFYYPYNYNAYPPPQGVPPPQPYQYPPPPVQYRQRMFSAPPPPPPPQIAQIFPAQPQNVTSYPFVNPMIYYRPPPQPIQQQQQEQIMAQRPKQQRRGGGNPLWKS